METNSIPVPYDLPVDRETIFSNHKHIYKKGIEKRQKKLLKKLEFLKSFLKEDEKIILVTTGCSPISVLEQLLTGWIVFYIKRALFVFTNNRLFVIPTKKDYSYRDSITQILYSDVKKFGQKGRTLIAEYKNDNKEKFYYLASKEKKKIRSLLSTLSLEGQSSKFLKRVNLCPRCTVELEADKFNCTKCNLEFKNKTEGKRISLIYPGGGYFYTRHPFLGIGDAITETFLIFLIILSLNQAINGVTNFLPVLLYFLILAFEKYITVYHSNHFINEFIPIAKDIKALPSK